MPNQAVYPAPNSESYDELDRLTKYRWKIDRLQEKGWLLNRAASLNKAILAEERKLHALREKRDYCEDCLKLAIKQSDNVPEI